MSIENDVLYVGWGNFFVGDALGNTFEVNTENLQKYFGFSNEAVADTPFGKSKSKVERESSLVKEKVETTYEKQTK